ncbi:AGAP007007-PA [Anopheles gambiae str. PEST]|uniref:AGAP007007-PA n=1 Tax=Anopheles gambiae TaxID=7165 RepID=A7URT2_ANOGA|nr:AGAP007007-PA [Anopheles gambiae str. PEST]
MRLTGTLCLALVALVAIASASPLDEQARAALFRRMRLGGPKGQLSSGNNRNTVPFVPPPPSTITLDGGGLAGDDRRLLLDAAIARVAQAHDRQLRQYAQLSNFSTFSDYFLAQLRQQNLAVAYAFDERRPIAPVTSEVPYYDEVDDIGDRRRAETLALNTRTVTTIAPPITTSTLSTTTSTDIYKHEDQSRPGVPVADSLDKVPAAEDRKQGKELAEEETTTAAAAAAAASSTPVPAKGGLNRLFARKKYSPLLRDGSKGAQSTTEAAGTVSPAAAASTTESEDGVTSSGTTRRTRPTRPGKLPRSTSPKPTFSVKPTKISSRFSKPTVEPTESTVAAAGAEQADEESSPSSTAAPASTSTVKPSSTTVATVATSSMTAESDAAGQEADAPAAPAKSAPKPERVIPVVERQDELPENESLLQSASYDSSAEQDEQQ